MRKLILIPLLALCGCAMTPAEKARIRATLIERAARYTAEDSGATGESRVTWVYRAR